MRHTHHIELYMFVGLNIHIIKSHCNFLKHLKAYNFDNTKNEDILQEF